MLDDARRCATRHGTKQLGTEKTPLCLLLRNHENVFRCYSSCMAQIRHSMLYVRAGGTIGVNILNGRGNLHIGKTMEQMS
jgi:hypothetical protein